MNARQALPKTVAAASVCALSLLACAGCGGRAEGGSSISAAEFYAAMQVGKFTAMSHADLDKIAQGLCGDLKGMDPKERKLAVLVVKESTDTAAEAFRAGRAMTSRWCPEYVDAFDAEGS